MPLEIERKFLLANEGWRQYSQRSVLMTQGYLARSDKMSIRVRLTDQEAWLNIKQAVVGRCRQEYEYTIPLEDAQQLLALCTHQISKRRHYVAWQEHEWEVDEFFAANQGLVVAELELNHVDEVFALPPWLGKEVTDDPRYYNAALAITSWHEAGLNP